MKKPHKNRSQKHPFAQSQVLDPEDRPSRVGGATAALWEELFTTPIHLDSALAKRTPGIKTLLAQLIPPILLRPASLAERYGIGMAPGEPWTIPNSEPNYKLAHWRGAQLLAEAIHARLDRDRPLGDPVPEDFPAAMVEEWRKDFGSEVSDQLIQVLGSEAPLSLRARARLGAAALLKELRDGAKLPVRSELSELSPLGVRLAGYAPVLHLPAFERGDFEIQDEGSQFMAMYALDPERAAGLLSEVPGPLRRPWGAERSVKEFSALTVIDACAGAGGKTLAMADLLGGRGRVFAYDVSARKLEALRRRGRHAGFNNIQTKVLPEGQEDEAIAAFHGKADIVLVDAPCSGWGVLRRSPDIKWRQDRSSLERLPDLQLRLLETYSKLVAPGGRLVFGVCTFRRSETLGVVEKFSQHHSEFLTHSGGYLGPGPSDGFFMHSWIRKA